MLSRGSFCRGTCSVRGSDQVGKKRRVVITGMGVISPVGIGINDFGKVLLKDGVE